MPKQSSKHARRSIPDTPKPYSKHKTLNPTDASVGLGSRSLARCTVGETDPPITSDYGQVVSIKARTRQKESDRERERDGARKEEQERKRALKVSSGEVHPVFSSQVLLILIQPRLTVQHADSSRG